MKRKINLNWSLPILLGLLVFASCQRYFFRNSYDEANIFLNRTKDSQEKSFLKAHLKNGEVYLWNVDWKIDTVKNVIVGKGAHYNTYRKLVKEGYLELPISEVSIFETNRLLEDPEGQRIKALTVLGIGDLAVGVFCALLPVACFGSCPTFYLNPNSNFQYADAEGFSSATLPRLSYADADAFPELPASRNVEISMRNEAMETHVVKGVRLKVFPKEKGKTVVQGTDHKFYSVTTEKQPIRAQGQEGDVLPAILSNDHFERSSLANSESMLHQEEIYLEYEEDASKRLGLALNFRQTLMTTYLFYTALDCMGADFAEYYAKMEATGKSLMNHFSPMKKLLGGIEVSVFDEKKNQWVFAGAFSEIGPISIEKQLVVFPSIAGNGKVKVRLKMNQGLWRIDAAKLVTIEKEVTPLVVEPQGVYDRFTKKSEPLPTSTNPMVTYPGKQVQWKFSLPSPGNEWVTFLESEGYYLEWSRSAWVKDKNLPKLISMGVNPKLFLKNEIKNYKKYEKFMENEFWDSRYSPKEMVYENR